MSRVAVITDSIADLPKQITDELAIGVVPLQVRFGNQVYRDGIDITPDEFYRKLAEGPHYPSTSVPTPSDFIAAFDAADATDILVITLSSKLSGTYDVARSSVALMNHNKRVQVIDSGWAIMAQGFVVMAAARAAHDGATLEEAASAARFAMQRVEMRGAFDTLEYLKRGGRIGAASSLLGSVLNINPVVKMRDGVVAPAGRAHSRSGAIRLLYDFVTSYKVIEGLAIEDGLAAEDATALAARLSAALPGLTIHRSRMTPAIGTHTGPSMLAVSVLGDRETR